MATIAANQGAQNQASNSLLKATLGAGPAGLGTSPQEQSFLDTAAKETGFTETGLAQKQSSILNELASNAAQVPLAGRNQARIGEAQEHADALSKLHSERGRVAEEIPNDISKARAELTKEEVGRAGTRLQRELTEQQIGQRGELGKEANKAKQITAEAQRARNEVSRENNAETNRTKRAAENYKKEHEKEILTGKQWAAAQKWFNEYRKFNSKTEYLPGSHTPQEEQGFKEKNMQPHQRSAQEAYEYLTENLGLNALQAFRLLKTGGGYFATYGREHEKIYKETEELRRHPRPATQKTSAQHMRAIPTRPPPTKGS
jgi:hypothetical protein